MQATLTGFHHWDSSIGQHCESKHNSRVNDPDWVVSKYREYLETELGLVCEDSDVKFSHWGPNSHKIEIHWGDDIVKTVKPKRIDFKAWVRKNHPEVLKEFKQVVNE